MPAFQILPKIYVPTFEMTVADVPLPMPVAKSVVQISVTQHMNPPDSFSIQINDPALSLISVETGIFTEGNRVEIGMGFVGNTKKLIVGEITAVSADFPSSGAASLTVEGFDLLHKLSRGNAYRRWEGPTPNSGMPDSTIVVQIVSDIQMAPDVDTTPARNEPRVQNHISDLAFLQLLAKLNGFYVWADGSTIHFKQQRPPATNLSMEWGKTLMSFSPRLTTAGQVDSVEVRGWDPVQKQSVSAMANRTGDSLAPTGQTQIAQGSGGASALSIADASVTSAQDAQAYAQSIIAGQQQSGVTGSGVSVGQPDMQAGSTLDLGGIGRFSGTYVVNQVTHTLGSGGYQTSFQAWKQS
jgi:hypothetical protein